MKQNQPNHPHPTVIMNQNQLNQFHPKARRKTRKKETKTKERKHHQEAVKYQKRSK